MFRTNLFKVVLKNLYFRQFLDLQFDPYLLEALLGLDHRLFLKFNLLIAYSK